MSRSNYPSCPGLSKVEQSTHKAVAAAERLRGSIDRGLCRDAAGWRPRLLAAVVRSRVRSAFTAERQNVSQTGAGTRVTKPTIEVEVVFLSADEGGRQSPPVFGTAAEYRPHLVLQDRTVRQARMRGNVVEEEYLAVSFVEGPRSFALGEPVRCVLRLSYFPEVDYADLREGATFTVREGARIVAHGIVLNRRSAG